MKKILLTQGQTTTVDKEDYKKLNTFKWFAQKNNGKYFAGRNSKTVNGQRTMIIMHRVILNPPVHLQIDHINGDSLDNRKCNLRICNSSQNKFNKKVYKNNKLGIKGVYWNRRIKKFATTIQSNNKRIFLESLQGRQYEL